MKPSDFRKANPHLSDSALALAYALSPLERAKQLTQNEVDKGRLLPWVMGDVEARDRANAAKDRRAAFYIVK